MTYAQYLFVKFNLQTDLKTCPTVSLAPGNLYRKIFVVAVRTTRTLLIPPRHCHESVPPKDVVLEGCLM